MIRVWLPLTIMAVSLILVGFAYGDESNFPGRPFTENGVQKVKDIGKTQPPGGGILLTGDCSDYIDLTAEPLPISVTGTTAGATNNYGPFYPRPGYWEGDWYTQSGSAPDVTFKWTAPQTRSYTISLCGSGYDTALLLYEFTCPFEPVYPDDYLCGNDDSEYCADNIRSEMHCVRLSAGQEILIVVDGYGNNTGPFELSIKEALSTQIDSFITEIMRTYPIHGLQACAIKNNEVIWSGAFGDAYINQVDVTDSTIFSLASISKTVTATALMQLYEDGLIDLDTDINDYLPFFVENPHFPGSIMTPRMLMAHTSSIRDHLLNGMIVPGDHPTPLGTFLLHYLSSDSVLHFDSLHPPGDIYAYSNVGNALGGYLVEILNPDSLLFDQYCQQHIFAPLGMDNTGWFLADFPDTMQFAMPYRWNGIPYGHYGQPYYPACQLRTTSLEMAKFLTAIMQYGQLGTVRILDSTTVEQMISIQYPGISRSMGHPGEAAIGWFDVDIYNLNYLGHLGRWWGVTTGMFYRSEENTGVIVLTNEDFIQNPPFPDENMHTIFALFDFASGWPYGYLSGVVTDTSASPIEDVYINASGTGASDFSNAGGEYMLYYLPPGSYDISFSHDNYFDTTVTGVTVTAGDTAVLNMLMTPGGCNYIVGDVNGPGSYNGLDITYGVNFFKYGSPTPQCPDCPLDDCNSWHYCGDVNGSCNYNGLDITYGVNYFKYGSPAPLPCDDCPPVE